MADNILITGGTGSMGRRLLANLLSRGYTVRVLALPGDAGARAAEEAGAEVVFGDISDPETLRDLCHRIDTVYHLAAVILAPGREELFEKVNVAGTRNIISEARRSMVRHFIHVSSASVVYPHPNAYSLSKRASEDLVKNSGLAWTLVRPTLAYEDNGAAEFMHYVNFLKRFPMVPLIGNGRALKSPVHVDDIVEGLTAIAGKAGTRGKTYNFSGGSTLSLRKMSELLLNHMGKRKPLIPVPVFACRLLALGLRFLSPWLVREPLLTWQTISGVTQDAALDNTEAQHDLAFFPRPFEAGLATLTSLKSTSSNMRQIHSIQEGGSKCMAC